MRIVTTTVGCKGPEGEGRNQERLRAAERAIAKAAQKLQADLIVLPAGFFTTQTSRARENIADSLISIADRLGIGIAFGVDQEVKDLNRRWEREIRSEGLPFYGYAWSPNEGITHCWKQRSTNSSDQWLAPLQRCKEPRLVPVSGEPVAVLMCGEIFNQRIRDALANHPIRPKVVVDLAHIGAGFRVWQGMKKLVELGLASVCSVHTQSRYAVKYCYVPGRGRISARIPDDWVFGPPRIELKVWTFQ